MSNIEAKKTMRVFEMFSGIGGFAEAFRREGHEVIGHSEIDDYADSIYSRHFTNRNYGDCTIIVPEQIPDFDILCGGFPCQAFSIAGKRRGFEDTRGTLFFEIARIAKAKRPKYLLLENVKGLLNHDKGKTFGTIISTLVELGYDVEWGLLNTRYFGIPQNRERVFIIGHLRTGSRRKIFPIRFNDQETYGKRCELNAIDTNTVSTFNSKNRVYDPEGISKTLSAGNKGGGEGGQRTGLYRIHCTQKRGSDRPSLLKNKNAGGSGPLNKQDGTVYCLDTGNTQAVEIEPYRIRRLTPRECERLQGFPDRWTELGTDKRGNTQYISDHQRYKVLGNALTVKVAQEIIKRMEMS